MMPTFDVTNSTPPGTGRVDRQSSLDCIWEGREPYPELQSLLLNLEVHLGVEWSEHRARWNAGKDASAKIWADAAFAGLCIVNRIRLTGSAYAFGDPRRKFEIHRGKL
jgi:hypothetical protein